LFVLAVPFLQFLQIGTKLWNFSQNLALFSISEGNEYLIESPPKTSH
jgi:hypothetical protein